MEEQQSQNSTTNKESNISKMLWISTLPTLGALGYSAVYLTGVVYHQTWASHFSAGVGLFEKSTTDYLLYAYAALIHICSNWLNVLTDPWIVLSTLGLVFLAVAELVLLTWLPQTKPFKAAGTTINKNKLLGLPLGVLALSSSITCILLLLPLAANLFLITPAITGYKAAQLSIEKHELIYSRDCQKAAHRKDYCVRVIDGDNEIARGYLIDSSNDRIALYKDGKSTVLALNNYRIETLIPTTQATNSQLAR
ncbi:hypothetical protein NVV93_06150 [Pseudomonas sp. LS44]|uniref:hypothetical protein n=1 Tax=Pseudomonas sp. LS44 TaxID=1357074 RepID=UPI00215A33ED|nr:hypothetical protein [Pseudomonas sp. LS44]UVE18968.1 hypothetical protein NVV93_06150 [Pseudomonas sp. LS44]